MELIPQPKNPTGMSQSLATMMSTRRSLPPTRPTLPGGREHGEGRTQHLERFKEAFFSYEEELTEVLLKETGKPRMFGAMEVKSCAEFFDWYTNMKEPQLQRTEDDETTVQNKYIPLGVVGAICPWNFPLLLSLAEVLPATRMGNTIIVKPSPISAV
jgi:acyl-CoA reductase-like NAD-dependent aldehyde dehydrogenase